MGKLKDLTGQRFGRLTVIERVGTTKARNAIWLCKCDCGNETKVNGGNLTSNSIKSCGCLRQEQLKTHGLSYSNLYPIWISMKDRCFNPNNKEYHCYGGRGISICDEWKNNFENFYTWAKDNGYDENAKYGECTIDRIDVNGNYEPSNCRWITMKEQQRNRRDNHLLTYDSETRCVSEWAEILGVNYGTFKSRIKNWTIEKAFNAER